jgi:hypothetical protein
MVLRRGALLSCCSLQRCGSLIYCYASRYLRVPWMLRSCRPVIICLEGFDRRIHTAPPKSPDAACRVT